MAGLVNNAMGTATMDKRELRAYHLGRSAYVQGIIVSANPYTQTQGDVENTLRVRWYDGWYDAMFFSKYHDSIWESRC